MARNLKYPTETQVSDIKAHLLAGWTLQDVKDRHCESGFPAVRITEIRKQVFDRLRTDPEAVKELASGPLLNANSVVRYTGLRPKNQNKRTIKQLSILDVCDGKMNVAAQ